MNHDVAHDMSQHLIVADARIAELESEVARLSKERQEWFIRCQNYRLRSTPDWQTAAEAAEAQRDRALVALRTYGGHHSTCKTAKVAGFDCTCGLSAALSDAPAAPDYTTVQGTDGLGNSTTWNVLPAQTAARAVVESALYPGTMGPMDVPRASVDGEALLALRAALPAPQCIKRAGCGFRSNCLREQRCMWNELNRDAKPYPPSTAPVVSDAVVEARIVRGWLKRQVDADIASAKDWPDWMRRAADLEPFAFPPTPATPDAVVEAARALLIGSYEDGETVVIPLRNVERLNDALTDDVPEPDHSQFDQDARRTTGLTQLTAASDAVVEALAFTPTHRHYKGELYQVIGCGSHSETLDPLMVYRDGAGSIWARPYAMFHDTMPDGTPRFAALPPAPERPEGEGT